MDLRRGLSAEGRVGPRAVIVGDPPADAGPGLRAGLEGVEIDALVFERAPEPLDEHVIEPAAATVHGYANADVVGEAA